MEKVGRNDPCPCGSGKKYKKCHGASNVIEINPGPYNAELDLLHEKLLTFATEEYTMELAGITERYPEFSIMEDEERMDIYMTGLITWAIFYEPVEGQQTIFDIFYQRQKSKIKHERVKKAFESWRGRLPSLYEIQQITEEKVFLLDLRTEESYQITRREEAEFEVGTIVIGMLLPFVQKHEFFIALFELIGEHEEMIKIIESTTVEDLKENYPEILGEILRTEYASSELEWERPEYEMVAGMLTDHMSRKHAMEMMIAAGVAIWKRFTEEAHPNVRKLGAYAAAVDYIVQKTVLLQSLQSQKDLAAEYGTSSNTISKHSRTITEVLGDEIKFIFSEMAHFEKKLAGENSTHPLLTMEKSMRDMLSVLEGKEFESEEELQQFLSTWNENQDFISTPSVSPRDIAQDKLYEAYEVQGAQRKQLISEALKIYPNSPDAYLLMAEDAKTMNEAYQLYHQAVLAGKKDLGKAFFEENKGDFWMMVETRPFMRAKAELANIQHAMGDIQSAMGNYEEMLELNPSDNQGIRYLLLSIYLEAEQYESAQALLKRYDNENVAQFNFNEVLLRFLSDGLTSDTKSLLKKADKQNPYVKDYLTGKKAIPRVQPDYIGIGDQTEAIVYAQTNLHLWEKAALLIGELERLY